MSLYRNLKASLTESICLMKHLEEEEQEVVDFNYILTEKEQKYESDIDALEKELVVKDTKIKELQRQIDMQEDQTAIR